MIFMNDTAELLIQHTCDVMNESVNNTVRTVERASMMNTTSQFWWTALDQFMTPSRKTPFHSSSVQR